MIGIYLFLTDNVGLLYFGEILKNDQSDEI